MGLIRNQPYQHSQRHPILSRPHLAIIKPILRRQSRYAILRTQQIDLTNHPLVFGSSRHQAYVFRKRKTAVHLWKLGRKMLAIRELQKIDLLGAQRNRQLRSKALEGAQESPGPREEYLPHDCPRRVRFEETPQVLGTADAHLDRRPIPISHGSKLEYVLLRATREFPHFQLEKLDMDVGDWSLEDA